MDIFTASDRRRIQIALDLPIEELEESSDLWIRLEDVERFDQANGTTIAVEIQGYLAALDVLDATLEQSYTDGSAAAATASYKVDEYSESLSFGQGDRSIGSGYQERRQFLIQRLLRDLGYLAGSMGGRIPVM